MNGAVRKSVLSGVIGALSLISLYFLVLTLANSLSHAWQQFQNLWYLITPLVLGFGAQVGLYIYLKQAMKIKNVAKKELAASGTVSLGAMIACCAHHLVDILPILGLSAVFLFLAQYQIWFLLAGILSNVFGIILLLRIYKKMRPTI